MRNCLQCLIILVIVVREISAQSCVFKWENGTAIAEDDIKYPIDLKHIEDIEQPGKTLITLIGENVDSIESISTDSAGPLKYINATLQSSLIVLKLTEDFVDFEKYETRARIYIRIEFNCRGVRGTLEINQPIIDTNNHDPEFIDAPYTYKLPMPFPSDFRVDLLGKISARDIDLTNNNISFSLDPEDPVSEAFGASWLSSDPANSKLHYGSLETKSILHLPSEITFHLYATDSGNPPRIVNTTVTINIDKDNSILSFSKPVYSANCSNLLPEEADGFTLEFEGGDISLSGGTTGKIDWNIEDVSGKYDDNFKINSSSGFGKIGITLVNPPPSFFNETNVLLILNAKKSGAVESAVLRLILPGRELNESPDVSPGDNECTDCTAVIITLAVLLAIVSAALIAFIVLSRRSAKRAEVEKINGAPEAREEMREVDRMESDPSPNGLPRRSVAFNDTVEEIKVARL